MSEHRLDRIVIERPRGGMRISSRRVTGHKKELNRITAEASEDGLLQPYLIKTRNQTKYFSDHLSPLRRWLNSRVGQPWDWVYSQLSQILDFKTLSGQHILSHLWDFVERDAILIEGIPYAKDCQDRPLYGCFYIHPETGILCRVPKPQKKKPPVFTDRVWIDRYQCYRKLDDIWYLVSFQDLPLRKKPFDLLLRSSLTPNQAITEYGSAIYACHKRHATKREIRQIQQKLQAKQRRHKRQRR